MDNNQEFEYPYENQNNKSNIIKLFAIIFIVIIIAVLAISIGIYIKYLNNYGTSCEYDSIYEEEYSQYRNLIFLGGIYDNSLIITAVPPVDIKNLTYTITFNGKYSKGISFSKDMAKANEPITHIFNLEDIEKNHLNNEEYRYFSYEIDEGKIQNKYKNKKVTPSFNKECTFNYEISQSDDLQKIYCTITNNTQKTITCINDCYMKIKINETTFINLYNQNITFLNPLGPNQSQIVDMTRKATIYFVDENNEKKSVKYSNIKGTNYDEEFYSVVYKGMTDTTETNTSSIDKVQSNLYSVVDQANNEFNKINETISDLKISVWIIAITTILAVTISQTILIVHLKKLSKKLNNTEAEIAKLKEHLAAKDKE